MQFFSGISKNTQSKSYMLSLAVRVLDFQNNALWDTHQYALFGPDQYEDNNIFLQKQIHFDHADTTILLRSEAMLSLSYNFEKLYY